MNFQEVNILAVLIAALVSWAIGALWYSPLLFGKKWQHELGMTEESMREANMAVIFGLSFVLMFVAVMGLALLIQGTGEGEKCWSWGLGHGALTGLFFGATAVGINYLYQRRSVALWLIDAGYFVLFMSVSGIILSLW
ncbi:MAG: DUF1761 domain-containing protein [Bacteroidales bacterium]|nr:DUF1761 domain-containing protein [Bacteroidales bacterium]